MSRKIMLLFDSLSVHGEAVQYSIELAKRMDSSLVLLMLLPFESGENTSAGSDWLKDPEARVHDALVRHIEAAKKVGVSVETLVKMGDPPSELMKFLAGPSTFQTIVWGGEQDLTNKKVRQKKAHWLVKMKDILDCPVVIPSMKS
ncbi:MAG: hypothetical protein AUJ48_02045 [Deltaproteobacteria bacterium CG1_02_45_11]|nr:MAG: hypothetical protein AUJ48_02045 [Deltaproteobacteria bacterium CG1_02_45_11]